MPGRLRPPAFVAAALAATCLAGAAQAAPDIEDPRVVSCGLFLELAAINAPRFLEYRAWVEGLASFGARATPGDVAADMEAIEATCRADRLELFSAVAIARVSGAR